MEITLDTNVRAARQLAAGRVTVTFKSPTGQHITLTAKARGPKENGNGWETCSVERARVIFIEVPNDSGYGDKVGKVTGRAGFVADPSADKARVWCAEQLLNIVAGRPTAPSLEIYVEDTCGKCGRALTDPISIERGIGPDCFGADTGSQHQVKVKGGRDDRPSADVDADGKVDVYLAPTDEEQLEQARVQAASARPRPRSAGGGSGGTWQERKRRIREQQEDAGVKLNTKHCSQLTELPGTTWEDIFGV